MFPERGIVFDFFFQKVGSTWATWEDMIEKSITIPQGAKVQAETKTLAGKQYFSAQNKKKKSTQ